LQQVAMQQKLTVTSLATCERVNVTNGRCRSWC
jgi:hypothetical protein